MRRIRGFPLLMLRNVLLLGGLINVACCFPAHAQTYSVLKHFSGADGQGPVGPLILSGTTLYGTTYLGGNSDYGTVFKVLLDGTGHSVLKHFGGPSDTGGSIPTGHLILSGSTLFGTVEQALAGTVEFLRSRRVATGSAFCMASAQQTCITPAHVPGWRSLETLYLEPPMGRRLLPDTEVFSG